MKALRYLLILIAMVSVLGVSAQTLAQMPKAQMKSTSGMVYSGSQLPSAAAQGTYVTGSIPGTYTPANAASGPARAKKGDDDWEDDDPHEDEEPWTTPVGDAGWPLAMLAVAYALLRVYKRERRV